MSCTDPSGSSITLQYGTGTANRLQTITDSVGNVLDLLYCSGQLSQVFAPPLTHEAEDYGRVWFVNYDGTGKLESITRAAQQTYPHYSNCASQPSGLAQVDFTYQATGAGRMISISDYEGHVTSITYQTDGRVDEVTHPEVYDYVTDTEESTTRTYDFTTHDPDSDLNPCEVASTEDVTITDERGEVSVYSFDESGRLITVEDQLARTVATNVWNDDNRLDSVEGVLPDSVTTLEYDSVGNTTLVEDPNTSVTEMTYDTLNNLTSLTDPVGNIVGYDFDDTTNPTRPTLIDGPGDSDIALEYGQTSGADLGQPTLIQSPNGTEQTFTFQDGFLQAATWGRKVQDMDTVPLQDGHYNRGPTGNPDETFTHYYIAEVCSAATGCNVGDANDVFVAEAPGEGELVCPCEPCRTRSESGLHNPNGWADQVCGVACDGVARNQTYFDARDGNGRPLKVRHFHDEDTYTQDQYTYDALGRNIVEIRDANSNYSPDSQIQIWDDHYAVRPSNTVERFYSDSTGRYKVRVTRPQDSSVGDREIETEYFTDAAGRITQIKRDGVTVATYEYEDSTTLPAVTEYKALSGITTEYYLDKAGRVMKVIHLRDTEELIALEYERDEKNRITQIEEYRDGTLKATTTYAYGDGNLTSNDLDSSSTPDPDKLYWNWLPSAAMQDSDPNRLVFEQRFAEDEDDYSYRKEYWYDPGGNRLAMRWSYYDTQEEEWRVDKVTRYNYSHKLDYDPENDTPGSVPIDFEYDGDPETDLLDTATEYDGNGLDRLYSYHSYSTIPLIQNCATSPSTSITIFWATSATSTNTATSPASGPRRAPSSSTSRT